MLRVVRLSALVCALACLLAPSAALAAFPSTPGNDSGPSMGQFYIWVDPAFKPMVQSLGCYVPSTNLLISPILIDPNTVIARSGPAHTHGSASDANGVAVGSPTVTTVSDSDFLLVPTVDFQQGPAGTNEIHTLIKKLNLFDAASGIAVRAGPDAGIPVSVRKSAGEVEGTNAGDFPNGESFFDIFAEIDLGPAIGNLTLYNDQPLAVVNSDVDSLPPKVVYIHGESNAVPVKVKATNQLFGYLRLAGHGMRFECVCDPNSNPGLRCEPPSCLGDRPAGSNICPDGDSFSTTMHRLAETSLMTCPECDQRTIPTLGRTATVVLVVLLLGAGTLLVLRRRQTALPS